MKLIIEMMALRTYTTGTIEAAQQRNNQKIARWIAGWEEKAAQRNKATWTKYTGNFVNFNVISWFATDRTARDCPRKMFTKMGTLFEHLNSNNKWQKNTAAAAAAIAPAQQSGALYVVRTSSCKHEYINYLKEWQVASTVRHISVIAIGANTISRLHN